MSTKETWTDLLEMLGCDCEIELLRDSLGQPERCFFSLRYFLLEAGASGSASISSSGRSLQSSEIEPLD